MNLPPLINVNSHSFVVIIPAAGSSERLAAVSSGSTGSSSSSATNGSARNSPVRFGAQATGGQPKTAASRASAEPKQYQLVCDKPLIFHTVSAFLRLKWIDQIIVAAPADSVAKMERILSPLVSRQQKRFDCIPGGSSRHRSIREALTFIEESRRRISPEAPALPDMVIVHDGARPIIDGDTLHQLVSNCEQWGAAGVVCRLTSTILSAKAVNPQLLTMGTALDRGKYWASETPQAFRYALLVEAYNKCTEHELEHNTECLDLVQRHTKTTARLIQVDPSLYFKVTYRKDLYAADNVLKERRNVLLHCDFIEKSMSVNFAFIKQLKDDLCFNFSAVNYFNNSTVGDKYQSSAALHSTGVVHILLHYCHSWADIVVRSNENNLANYDSLIYVVVLSELVRRKADGSVVVLDGPNGSTISTGSAAFRELDDSAYPQLIQWTRRRVPAIKNFYLILANSENLVAESQRIRNTVVYLCKELPVELSGQCFFI